MINNITITQKALDFLLKSINAENNKDLMIYLSVLYPFTKYAQVNIIYCVKNDLNKDDVKLDISELNIYVDNKSYNLLRDAIIDMKKGKLLINAPNIFSKNDKNIKEEIKYLFENEINTILSQHGGFVELVDISNNDTLVIRFHGGCQGCGLAGYTLNSYIEKTVKNHFPQIKKINDVTAHEIRDNAYY